MLVLCNTTDICTISVHPGKSVRSECDGSLDSFFIVNPLGYFSFQPVLHDWCNKGCGMCYPVCGGAKCSSVVRAFALWYNGSSDRSFMMDPFSYFSLQPVLHDWWKRGRGMCYPICGMVHIKDPLLIIGKSSPCGGSGFPLSLSEWSFTICTTPYNRK